jgi:selenocysteine lyase/cysteine desulfurase
MARLGDAAMESPGEAVTLAYFLNSYPAFATTSALNDLRATEYARLDATGQTYLDYTGGGLHAESQVRQHMALVNENVFGNPHSENPTSLAMTERIEQTRAGPRRCGSLSGLVVSGQMPKTAKTSS